MQIDGINGKMKCRRKHRQGRSFGCVGDWAVLRRSVCGRLYGCGSRCLRCREDAGCRVGLTALPGAAMWRGLVPLRQRGNGSFRLSAALAPWSAVTILRNGMPTAWLYHKAGQMLHHNAISLPVCRCTFHPKGKPPRCRLTCRLKTSLP